MAISTFQKRLLNGNTHPFTTHRHSRQTLAVSATNKSVEPITKLDALKDGTTLCAPLINGCWQLAGGHGREVFDDINAKLAAHASAGLTTFDTADIYGPSEQILGQFSNSWRASGGAPIQIYTKFVPNIFQTRMTPSNVEAAIKMSATKLQTQSLDLVQLHWWDYSIPGMVDTALALADLKERGLIKAIGVTNIDCQALVQIVDAGVPIVSNQVQFSLLDRRPLHGMLKYCEALNIRLFTYGSLGGGLLSDRYVEEPKTGLFGKTVYPPVDLNTSSLKMYWNVVKRFGGQDLWRELLTVLRKIADKHSCTTANVSLRWVMQQGSGELIHPIVGLRGISHIGDNIGALKVVLDQSDMDAIQAVLDKSTGPEGDIYSFERA